MFEKFNIGALMKGAQKIQEMMEKNQEEMSKLEVAGESGAGLVRVVMNGLYSVKSLEIADELLTESKEILQELVAAAINNASEKVTQATRHKIKDFNQFFGDLTDNK